MLVTWAFKEYMCPALVRISFRHVVIALLHRRRLFQGILGHCLKSKIARTHFTAALQTKQAPRLWPCFEDQLGHEGQSISPA